MYNFHACPRVGRIIIVTQRTNTRERRHRGGSTRARDPRAEIPEPTEQGPGPESKELSSVAKEAGKRIAYVAGNTLRETKTELMVRKVVANNALIAFTSMSRAAPLFSFPHAAPYCLSLLLQVAPCYPFFIQLEMLCSISSVWRLLQGLPGP